MIIFQKTIFITNLNSAEDTQRQAGSGFEKRDARKLRSIVQRIQDD